MRPIHRALVTLSCAAALWAVPLAGLSRAQTVFQATPSTLGLIPDSVGECVGNDGPPLLVAIPASGLVGGLTNVSASITLSHTWMGEVSARLISPDGTEHVLFARTGFTGTDPGWGTRRVLNGAYSFSDAAVGNWWTAADAAGDMGLVPPDAYRTSGIGSAGPSAGQITAMNPVFANREGNGTWFVRFTDSCRLDVGTVSALSLTLTTNNVMAAPVAATPDNYIAGRNTPLVIPGPGVLANDINSPGSGALTATLTVGPANGTLTLNPNGGFTYVPNAGYLGPDSFGYYASNLVGNTTPTVVSLTVVPIQPPANLRVDRIVGNVVTIRWDPPPVGPRATSYVLEGGVTPGQPLVSLPTPAPVISVLAPSGSFFIRARALDGSMVSGVSNEAPLYVNVPVAPSAPIGLTALANNANLSLAWKRTYGGAAESTIVLDVTGSQTTSIPLGPSDTFSFAGVPAGTYTMTVRAQNAAGTSVASNPVTLTFPGTCSGAPGAPANYVLYNVGNAAFVLWDAPMTGTAATTYVLNVSSAFFSGALPVGANRSLTTQVPPGTYTVSVSAMNACGTSPATPPQSITVP